MHSCLARVPIFQHLSDEDKAYIHQFIRPRRYTKGESVLVAGQYQPEMLILNRGSTKVYRTTDSGDQQIVRQMKPGDYLGETAVFSDRAVEYDAVALEDSTFCTLSKDHLQQILAEHPEISVRLLADMSQRLQVAEAQLESLGQKSAEQRLIEALRVYADGRPTFRLPISKQDLAGQIGLRPETLSRLLRRLQDQGAIEVTGRSITWL